MTKQIKLSDSLKDFNYRLFGTLILISLLPTIYTTVRIYFLGNLPGDWGFNIASQLAWVNIFYEVVQEALILPLFYLISKVISNREQLSNRIQTGLVSSFLVFLVMTVLILIFVRPLLAFMGQKSEIITATSAYIRLEAIAIQISVLFRFISIVLIILNKNSRLLILLAIQMVLTIVSDTFLVSSLSISFQIGVNGIALGNIIVNLVLVGIGLTMLKQEGLQVFSYAKANFSWQKEWIKIGGLSGIESFVRNAAFTLMIIRMINMIQEQGTFWVANNFIWGWLLLPILALGELIKRNTAESAESIDKKLPAYWALTGLVCILWLVTIPFWNLFIGKVMNVADYTAVVSVAIISLVFYIIFAFNNVVDSIFYGLGRTDLMLYQSLIVNTVYYGGMFIAYRVGLFIPSLNGIAIMFGTGMAIDSVITFIMFIVLRRINRLVLSETV
ncbi:MAG: multidrug transporter [Spirochaetae bacterium HGW-Spirochaetae-3]|jgi:Na+-driven multidrug efflux pump|nr:MAG: multidrug transporter [Spirochaetae bacterium HGW-Spirochaetae-3]